MLANASLPSAAPHTNGVTELSGCPSLFGLSPRIVSTDHKFDADEEIFGEGELAIYVYQVVYGSARTYKLLSDGRRQISAFHLPGDVFGLCAGGEHKVSAEAITPATVRMVKAQSLRASAETDAELACALWRATVEDLRRAEDHMMLLGRKSAVERIATFLLEMDQRLARTGQVALPMSRRDIADYLGVTIETVSRTVAQLQRDGVLRLEGARRIKLADRNLLTGLAL